MKFSRRSFLRDLAYTAGGLISGVVPVLGQSYAAQTRTTFGSPRSALTVEGARIDGRKPQAYIRHLPPVREQDAGVDDLLNPALPGLPPYDIPEAWLKVFGRPLWEYAGYLDRLPLRFITVRQAIAPHLKKIEGLRNSLPPQELWPNMQKPLLLVEWIGRHLNQPVQEVTSAYRSPKYNKKCGGVSNSRHKENNALDVKFPVSPAKVAAVARQLRQRGVFYGGVGSYSTFTHLDTRGENVDW